VLYNADGPSSLVASLSMVVKLLKGRVDVVATNRVYWGGLDQRWSPPCHTSRSWRPRHQLVICEPLCRMCKTLTRILLRRVHHLAMSPQWQPSPQLPIMRKPRKNLRSQARWCTKLLWCWGCSNFAFLSRSKWQPYRCLL
jgi:hypothetical protein